MSQLLSKGEHRRACGASALWQWVQSGRQGRGKQGKGKQCKGKQGKRKQGKGKQGKVKQGKGKQGKGNTGMLVVPEHLSIGYNLVFRCH